MKRSAGSGPSNSDGTPSRVKPGRVTAPAVDALNELLGGESTDSRRFLGGLVAGALVGAAIAGSSIWRQIMKGKH